MEGLVVKGERSVIPVAIRKDMLKQVHIGHMGMMKCKNRAKEGSLAKLCPSYVKVLSDFGVVHNTTLPPPALILIRSCFG